MIKAAFALARTRQRNGNEECSAARPDAVARKECGYFFGEEGSELPHPTVLVGMDEFSDQRVAVGVWGEEPAEAAPRPARSAENSTEIALLTDWASGGTSSERCPAGRAEMAPFVPTARAERGKEEVEEPGADGDKTHSAILSRALRRVHRNPPERARHGILNSTPAEGGY